MIATLPLTYLHVFTYSPRPGTPAAAIRDQVPIQIARERNKILRELGEKKKLAFMRSLIGKQLDAITLNSHSGDEADFTEALTDNFLKLRLARRYEANRWIRVCVEQIEGGLLLGVAAQNPNPHCHPERSEGPM
jgi:threonylcarbamoyladenosine tRNA methylthiotransferase MtaB